MLDVFRRYPAGAEAVAPGPDGRDDFVDFASGGVGRQPESPALGKQVVDARRAAVGADGHGEVAAFAADHGRGHQVVRRRQAPAAGGAAHRVVAGVVVVVGDRGVEDDAPEQLGAILVGLLRPAAQFVGEQGIGPALAVEIALVAVEQGEPAREPGAKIAALSVFAVETLHHEHIASSDRLDARVTGGDAAAAGELESRVFEIGRAHV